MLQADEAIESAVEEFEIQGYTLEGIIRAVGGAEALARWVDQHEHMNRKKIKQKGKGHLKIKLTVVNPVWFGPLVFPAQLQPKISRRRPQGKGGTRRV